MPQRAQLYVASVAASSASSASSAASSFAAAAAAVTAAAAPSAAAAAAAAAASCDARWASIPKPSRTGLHFQSLRSCHFSVRSS